MSQAKHSCGFCEHPIRRHDRNCSRKTCKYGPYCWQHTRSKYNVAVRKSTIPNAGSGLFAIESFNEGAKICPYTGELLTKEEVDARYGDDENVAEYVYRISKKRKGPTYIDASKTNACVARYANHDENRANAEFKDPPADKPPIVWIVATKKIRPGEEIFVNYGEEYWNKK